MKLKNHLYYSEKGIRLYNADCLDVMRKLPDDYVDLIVTDPPYGISFMAKEWDTFNEVKDIQKEFSNTVYAKKGFKKLPRNKPFGMIKFFVPIWKEALRVLKPGAFAFVMCAPRQDVLSKQIVALQEAGFETGFSSVYWSYATGFPKASNIGKKIDKRLGKERKIIGKKPGNYADIRRDKKTGQDSLHGGIATQRERIESFITEPASPQAKSLDGSYGGFQPKPAVEIIIVAMKPLSEKSYIDQALKNKHGITYLDNCRIPYESDNDKKKAKFGTQTDIRGNAYNKNRPSEGKIYAKNVLSSQKGRFPANLLVSNDVLNDGGNYKTGNLNRRGNSKYWGLNGQALNHKGSSGSYSRYFSLDKWWIERVKKLPPEVQKVFPYLIVPKASKREKNRGCENLPKKQKVFNGQSNQSSKDIKDVEERFTTQPTSNNHPTVKPIKLMSYLITLGSRENDIVLDPFAGSGTTLIASKLLNRKGIGIELSKEYCEIAKHRIKGRSK